MKTPRVNLTCAESVCCRVTSELSRRKLQQMSGDEEITREGEDRWKRFSTTCSNSITPVLDNNMDTTEHTAQGGVMKVRSEDLGLYI